MHDIVTAFNCPVEIVAVKNVALYYLQIPMLPEGLRIDRVPGEVVVDDDFVVVQKHPCKG